MPGTRSSARQAAMKSSSPASSQDQTSPAAGSKRKASGTPSAAKRGKKADKKEQTTIEASLPNEETQDDSKDVEMKDAEVVEKDQASDAQNETKQHQQTDEATEESKPEAKTNGEANREGKPSEKNGLESIMQNAAGKIQENNVTEDGSGSKVAPADNAVESSPQREEATPSSILEKGTIYFFFRGRVGINEPGDVNDIARSYIVLRPMPHGAKLGEGPIGDAKNVRMLSLPKKVLPVSPKDRFMMFVEKSNSTLEDVKQQLSSSDYSTKTAGVRHTPAATPIGEGVYAFTKTGRETHLAYILTIPSEISEVQEGIGLRQRSSYLTSVKNPDSAAPANASLPQGPNYPKEILDEFHGRGWMPLEPKLLDYENTQFLIIGHKDEALEKAAQPQNDEDENPEKETPLEEIEKLEHEDEIRVEHLKGDDSVFTDLGLSAQEYPKLQTTW